MQGTYVDHKNDIKYNSGESFAMTANIESGSNQSLYFQTTEAHVFYPVDSIGMYFVYCSDDSISNRKLTMWLDGPCYESRIFDPLRYDKNYIWYKINLIFPSPTKCRFSSSGIAELFLTKISVREIKSKEEDSNFMEVFFDSDKHSFLIINIAGVIGTFPLLSYYRVSDKRYRFPLCIKDISMYKFTPSPLKIIIK